MARNLYILAGTLLFFAAICFVMGAVGSRLQPGLPADGTLWRTSGLFLTVGGLFVAISGIFTAMFEQVDRRADERRLRERTRRR